MPILFTKFPGPFVRKEKRKRGELIPMLSYIQKSHSWCKTSKPRIQICKDQSQQTKSVVVDSSFSFKHCSRLDTPSLLSPFFMPQLPQVFTHTLDIPTVFHLMTAYLRCKHSPPPLQLFHPPSSPHRHLLFYKILYKNKL